MLRLSVILMVSAIAIPSFAQEVEVVRDTIKIPSDSLQIRKGGKIITIESYAKRYQPRKALLYAAVLPGMGQVYNKKYWKLPIVYGGFYVLTSFSLAYNRLHDKYKAELFGLLENPGAKAPSGFSEAQLRSITDNYRRQRDYFLILNVFWYFLQMIDAHVDAHLKEFDLNPQLRISVSPSVQQNYLIGQSSGVSITLKF